MGNRSNLFSDIFKKSSAQTTIEGSDEGTLLSSDITGLNITGDLEATLSGTDLVLNYDTPSGSNIGQVLKVGKSGSVDYNSIATAMSAISTATATTPFVIEVYSGIYVESNPITCKSWVTIQGIGTVIVQPSTASAIVFDLEANSTLDNLSIKGATSGIAISKTSTGYSSLKAINTEDCQKSIVLNNTNGSLNIHRIKINTVANSITNAIEVLAGNLAIYNTIFSSTSTYTCDNLFYFSGANVIATVDGVISFSTDLKNGIKIISGPSLVLRNISLINMDIGFYISGATDAKLFSSIVSDAQSYSVYVDSTIGETLVGLYSCEFENATTLDILIECSDCTVYGAGTTIDSSKTQIMAGVSLNLALTDLFNGDEGLTVLGELHVGNPQNPTESCFGEGDSHTVMFVYTETDENVFTDVTSEAKSSSDSTFTFPDVTANNSIYMASLYSNGTSYLVHHGIKYLATTACVLSSGEIVFEYWDGSAWTEINSMVTEGSTPYYPLAKQYFEDIGSFQLRYDRTLINTTNWVANDPISPALSIDLFWMRARIKTAITTAPIFQQLKLHASRSEINSDGWLEYFGRARPIGQLPFSIGQDKALEGNLGNQNLYINQNIGAGLNENNFNSTSDIIGRYFFIPLDLDTSTPIRLKIAGRPSANGTVAFTIRWDNKTEGDIAYTSEPSLIAGSKSTTQSATVTSGQIKIFTFDLDISDVIAKRESGEGDFIGATIQASTLIGTTFSLIALETTYTKWSEGGHTS